MTEPQTITLDHVRALLAAKSGGTVLALIQGRIEIISPERRDTEEHAGALEIISRDELAQRLGDDPNGDALSQQADALTVAVQQLGG